MSKADPIFAAIETHREAFALYLAIREDAQGAMWGRPRHNRYMAARQDFRSATEILTATPINAARQSG